MTDTGLVEPEVLEQALSSKVGLVSIMYANNEVGTIQPIAELVKLAHQVGAYFHTDAVQKQLVYVPSMLINYKWMPYLCLPIKSTDQKV